jgi:hypothetical protein
LKTTQAMSPPSTPPTSASSIVSSITAITTGVPRKPMARMVAISRARPATAAYMVLSAPNTAPMAMIAPITCAQDADQRGQLGRLLGVVVARGQRVQLQARVVGQRVGELLEAGLAFDPDRDRLIGAPVVGGRQRLDVGPQLRVVGIARGEHPDHRPLLVAQCQGLAHVQPAVLVLGALADHQLRTPVRTCGPRRSSPAGGCSRTPR